MKTFTNYTLTFKDEKLLQDAIEIIANETIVHNNTDKNTFTIYGNINVLIKTNHAEIETESKSMFQIDDANKLLNFLLVETNNLKGISHLRGRGTYFNDLNFKDQQHIRRLCKYPFFGASPESIYGKFVYGNMTPKEFKEEFEVSAKFITALRKANRKMIISSVIYEVTSNKKEGLAA
ncbi:MAG: hypothetical protein GQ531_10395 [Sulfurovum sp.]|nr:hypothetical protein [Sulfurovum sp.]